MYIYVRVCICVITPRDNNEWPFVPITWSQSWYADCPFFWPRFSHGDVINRRWYRPVINIAYAHCQLRQCVPEDFQWQISWTECGISMWLVARHAVWFNDFTVVWIIRANTSRSVTVVSMDLSSEERYFLPFSIGLSVLSAVDFDKRYWNYLIIGNFGDEFLLSNIIPAMRNLLNIQRHDVRRNLRVSTLKYESIIAVLLF